MEKSTTNRSTAIDRHVVNCWAHTRFHWMCARGNKSCNHVVQHNEHWTANTIFRVGRWCALGANFRFCSVPRSLNLSLFRDKINWKALTPNNNNNNENDGKMTRRQRWRPTLFAPRNNNNNIANSCLMLVYEWYEVWVVAHNCRKTEWMRRKKISINKR